MYIDKNIYKLKFSDLIYLKKLHRDNTSYGKNIRNEIERRLKKQHTFRPFADLKIKS